MKLISYILLLFITIGLQKTIMVENNNESKIFKTVVDYCKKQSSNNECCNLTKTSDQENKDCCDESCDGLMICCMQLNLISNNLSEYSLNLNYNFYQDFFSYKHFKLKSYLNKILDPPKIYII